MVNQRPASLPEPDLAKRVDIWGLVWWVADFLLTMTEECTVVFSQLRGWVAGDGYLQRHLPRFCADSETAGYISSTVRIISYLIINFAHEPSARYKRSSVLTIGHLLGGAGGVHTEVGGEDDGWGEVAVGNGIGCGMGGHSQAAACWLILQNKCSAVVHAWPTLHLFL